jgi:hypothetical protein
MSINLFNMMLADAGGTKAVQTRPNLPPPVQTTRPVATTPVTAIRVPTPSPITGTATTTATRLPTPSPITGVTATTTTAPKATTQTTPATMTSTSTASLPASVQQEIAQAEKQKRDAERDAADRALMQAMSSGLRPPIEGSQAGIDERQETLQAIDDAPAGVVGTQSLRSSASVDTSGFGFVDSETGISVDREGNFVVTPETPAIVAERKETEMVGTGSATPAVTPTAVTEELTTEETPEEIDTETIAKDDEESDAQETDNIGRVITALSDVSPTFMYSWDQQAYDETAAEYGVKVAEAVKNAVMARNQLAQQRAQALNAFYGGQYASASKIEKFGWTGGTATDEKMRMAYLSATLNSQMYNQKEMVLAGYDTELAVAREYANAQLTKLANEKYQQAFANAVGMAEVTGRYMSPEARDVLSNFFIAEGNPTDPRNAAIIQQTNNWLTSQGITPEEFEGMKSYFKQYISYSNTVPAQQWEAAVTQSGRAKQVFKTWGAEGQEPYQYSTQEWANEVAAQKTLGNKWDEESQTFIPDKPTTPTVITKTDDDGNIIEGGRTNTEVANDSNAGGLLDGFNQGKGPLLQSNFTVTELKKIMDLNPADLIPRYGSTGTIGSTPVITGYNLPSGITNKAFNSITKSQYDYLMQNWWNK